MKTKNSGSVLMVVMVSTLVLVGIVASLLSLVNTQRRLNLRKELQLQAHEVAESSVDYAYSYIVNDINSQTLASASTVPSSGYKAFTFTTAAKTFLKGGLTLPTSYNGKVSSIALSDPDVRVLSPRGKTSFVVDGNDPANAADPNKNMRVTQQLVPVIASVKASQSGQNYTAYVQKGISSREIALFQYAIFFQGQLHLHRGYGLMGGVHANGNLFLNAHDSDNAIYNGTVNSGHHIYRGSTFDVGGTGSDPFGYVAVTSEASGGWADKTTTPAFNPKVTGTSGALKIYSETVGATDIFVNLGNLDSTSSNWKTSATSLFKGHLEDSAMDSPVLSPVGSAGYTQDVAATASTNEFNNAPYGLLEPNLPAGNPNHKASLVNSLEAKASLILIVEFNTDEQITLHKASDGSSVIFNTAGFDYNPATNPNADLALYADAWRMFVVKAYKVDPAWAPSMGTDVHGYLTPVTLPTNDFHVIGKASADLTYVLPGSTGGIVNQLKFEDFDVSLLGSSGALVLPSSNHTLQPGTTACTPLMSYFLANPSDKTKLNTASTQQVVVNTGLFDSRLGRGIAPITIDIDALKKAMEVPFASITPANATNTDYLFRTEFNPTASLPATPVAKDQWNGLIYIEFPTSLKLVNTQTNAALAPMSSNPAINSKNGINTRRFAYTTSAELKHPDRWDDTDNYNRADRADKIVPMAPELRRYPDMATAGLNSTILDAQYVLPAVQIINGGVLPHPNKSTKGINEGFSIATNAPLYLVGNYNSDGDYTTGTNFSGTSPTSYSQADNDDEIPAAIFCDTFTVLSNGWGERAGNPHSNRENSFYGANNGSTAGNGSTTGSVGSPPGRPARARPQVTPSYTSKYYTTFKIPATDAVYATNSQKAYIEISASVATGEYPIFEFFTHALETYQSIYSAKDATHPNPIIFKGSVVAMFHSEVQHIKQAYGRNVNSDIQQFYAQHGAYAICAVRYHSYLANGYFPPGTPTLYVTQPKEFRLLRWGDTDDAALLTEAGFTVP